MIFQYVQENKKYYFGKKNCIYKYVYVIIHIHIRIMTDKYLPCICCRTLYKAWKEKCPTCNYSNQIDSFFRCKTEVDAVLMSATDEEADPDVVLVTADPDFVLVNPVDKEADTDVVIVTATAVGVVYTD